MNLSELLTLSGLWRNTRDTIRAPHEAARAVLALNLPRDALWLALALVITLSTLMASAVTLMLPVPPSDMGLPMPIFMGILQALFLVLGGCRDWRAVWRQGELRWRACAG